MANQYVSQSANNGYVVGNDGNPGTSPAQAVLTIEQAIINAVDGDTIFINDGTYTAPVSPGYWSVNESLTFTPENDLAVTLRGHTVQNVRIFNCSGTGEIDVVFGAINIDQQSHHQYGIVDSKTVAHSWTFNGTQFTNILLLPIYCNGTNQIVSVNVANSGLGGAAWERGGIYLGSMAAGSSLIVDGLTIDQQGRNNSFGALVYARASQAGVTASVKNVTGTSQLAASAGAFTHAGVSIRNIPNALIEDCDIDITGVGTGSAAAVLYEICADATGVQDSSYGVIRRAHGTNGTAAGKTALIGTDASNVTTNNQHNYGRIIDCNLNGSVNSNSIHGPMLSHGTGGRIMGCTTDYCGIGAAGLLKAMVAGLEKPMATGNKASHVFSSFCYQKGSVDAIHANNICITSAGYTGIPELANYDDTAVPVIQGSNGVFVNNIVTGVATAILAQQGTPSSAGADTTSGTQFYATRYDDSLGALANAWRNGDSTVYASIATFNTALAASGWDCVQADLGLDSNYEFASDSAFIGIGYRFWGTEPAPVGNGGEPFSDIYTDIGHKQSTYGIFHPVNL